jgi:hypothetical protein
MTIKNTFRRGVLAGLAALLPASAVPANADDIVIGTMGPTPEQFDGRITYSDRTDVKDTRTKTATQNTILKYWKDNIVKGHEKEFGVWAFANSQPYKMVEVEKANGTITRAEGVGDTAVGAGPRGSFKLGDGSMHLLTYGGVVIPTGDMEKGKPSLTGDAFDPFAGVMGTYFFDKDKKWEVDWRAQYNFAGENSLGKERPDYASGGIIAGREIFKNDKWAIRLGAGVSGDMKKNLETNEWENRYGATGVLRITPIFKSGKKWGHLEVYGTQDLHASKGMNKGGQVGALVRINFGK